MSTAGRHSRGERSATSEGRHENWVEKSKAKSIAVPKNAGKSALEDKNALLRGSQRYCTQQQWHAVAQTCQGRLDGWPQQGAAPCYAAPGRSRVLLPSSGDGTASTAGTASHTACRAATEDKQQ